MSYFTSVLDFHDYDSWVGKSPEFVLQAAKRSGGWRKVFPKGRAIPVWLSRIRNYFNICPTKLIRQGPVVFAVYASKIPSGGYGSLSSVKYLYLDELGRPWFQTPPGGTIWHSSGKPDVWYRKGEKLAKNTLGGQKVTEVFKLLHMDGSGGSSELIKENYAASIAHNQGSKRFLIGMVDRWVLRKVHGGGKSTLGKIGQEVKGYSGRVKNEKYAASYNYADHYMTSEDEHTRMDVDTHSEQADFYVKVPDDRSALNRRVFPKEYKGVPIAKSASKFRFGH